MTALFASADAVLRGRLESPRTTSPRRSLCRLLMLVVIFGMVYGAAMGTFAGSAGPRLQQILYSAIKVPILLLLTFAISLPSFFVLNTLLGVHDEFSDVLGILVSAQAVITMVLASLAPITIVWYLSVGDYHLAILFNAAIFAIASLAAQARLRRMYQKLIARRPIHRVLYRLWLIVFAFVGIQMGWVLRPFIGDPARPTEFFRNNAWSNAYLAIVKIVWQAVHWLQ